MSRKDAVILVSRALAMIQLITAFLEVMSLPASFVSLHHYASRINDSIAIQSDVYFKSYYQMSIAFIFAKTASLLVFAFLFWNCSAWMENVLLPKREEPSQSA
jgi:hypothetical protein